MHSAAHKFRVFAVFWHRYTCMCRLKHQHIHRSTIYNLKKNYQKKCYPQLCFDTGMYVTCQRIVLCLQKRFLSEKNMRSAAHKICVFAVFWYNYTCMCRVKHCHIHMSVIYNIIKKTVICRCILLHACMLHVNTSVYACKTDF